MSEVQKNPFEPFFDEIRHIIREEVRAAMSDLGDRENGQMLNATQAADFLNYSRDWVYRNQDKLGGRKVGKRGVRFNRRDLEAWAASRKIPGPS